MEIRTVLHREYLQELVNLSNISFGKEYMDKEHWQWRHLENPWWDSKDPELVVCLDRGRIIGANSFMPMRFRKANETLLALQSSDLMVHPDFKNQGIFSKMLTYSEKEFKEQGYEFLYGLPNRNSFPGFVKQGWHFITDLSENYRLVNLKILIRQVMIEKLGRGEGARNKYSFDSDKDNSLELKFYDCFPKDIMESNNINVSRGFEIIHSPDFLVWRLDKNPRGTYGYFVASQANHLLGYIIVRFMENRGIKYGVVIDIKIKNWDVGFLQRLFSFTLKWLKLNGFALIKLWGLPSKNIDSLIIKQYKFLNKARFPFNKLIRSDKRPLVVKPLNDSNLTNQLLEPESWDFSSLIWNII